MGRHSWRKAHDRARATANDETHEGNPRSVSRRHFARSALLAAPALVVAEQLNDAPSADAAAAAPWSVAGNTGTGSPAPFLGTTDAHSLVFKTNKVERMRVSPTGAVGIGSSTPVAPLHVQTSSSSSRAAFIDQAGTSGQEALTVFSATQQGGKAIAAYLTDPVPGAGAIAVYGSITAVEDPQRTDGFAIVGEHGGAGAGVTGVADGPGVGVVGQVHDSGGLAGMFQGADTGTALRSLTGSGTAAMISAAPAALNFALPTASAAGEFAGPYGVIGVASGDSNSTAGVVGVGGSTGYGVAGAGIYGVLGQGTGIGVVGLASQNRGEGVNGGSSGANGLGVAGFASGSGGTALYASFSGFPANSGYALQALGNARVTGSLSKGGGSFLIDHPQDPENKYLLHSFVESPDMMNIYNGVAVLDGHGRATVRLPGWFEDLNRDFRYQLTPLGGPAPDLHVAQEVTGGRFGIAGGTGGQRISWQITGIRQDRWAQANRIPVEADKPAHARGTYVHPELFGAPATRGEAYRAPAASP